MDDLTRTRRRVLALARSKFPHANDVRPVARSAGNGALMRAAPLAVAYCTRPDALLDAALAEAALTHWDPRCRLAQAAYDAAIACAFNAWSLAISAPASVPVISASTSLPCAATIASIPCLPNARRA